MIIADLAKIPGRTFPARRMGRGLAGQAGQVIPAKGFTMGFSVLEPHGGQVPWHNQTQEEIYYIVQGEGEICVGTERSPIKAGQAVYMPPTQFHQLTNTGSEPMHMIYIYCPGGDVAHWRQELEAHSRPPARVTFPRSPPERSPNIWQSNSPRCWPASFSSLLITRSSLLFTSNDHA